MNNVDKQYLNILQDILDNGTLKHTRAGDVLSVFGRQMRFNLKEGLPIITTKKVFTKGIIHELLWFISGSTNIKYLVDNNVHIWDDDAFRHYNKIIKEHNELEYKYSGMKPDIIEPITKEEFIDKVKNEETRLIKYNLYHYGDLGSIYGKQWRSFGTSNTDQIQKIIYTLNNNPDDRRMICMAFNPDVLNEVALPPCHVMFQLYSRELNQNERVDWLREHSNGEYDEVKTLSDELLDKNNVPKRALSLMYNMRSNDWCCGQPYNTTSYALLVYMLCEVCNMVPEELIFNGGDCHVYCNHIEAAKEQLTRQGYETLPKVKFARKITNINDFKFDDFIIDGYNSDSTIKYQLNVG